MSLNFDRLKEINEQDDDSHYMFSETDTFYRQFNNYINSEYFEYDVQEELEYLVYHKMPHCLRIEFGINSDDGLYIKCLYHINKVFDSSKFFPFIVLRRSHKSNIDFFEELYTIIVNKLEELKLTVDEIEDYSEIRDGYVNDRKVNIVARFTL